MASNAAFVDFVLGQLAAVPGVASRKMFGEHAIYHGSKVVALVCENQLFMKPTEAGRKFMGKAVEAPAYPGAKPSFLISELDDAKWLSALFVLTSAQLPSPKPKPKPAAKKGKTSSHR